MRYNDCIMVNMNNLSEDVRKSLAFTPEEIAQLEKARKMPITFDDDCPETTPELAIKFKRVNPHIDKNNIILYNVSK